MTEGDTTDIGDEQFGGATDQQKKYIGYLRNQLGKEKYHQILKDNNWGDEVKINELSKEEASHIIEKLKENLPQEQQNNQQTEKSSYQDRMKDYVTVEELLTEAHKKFKKLSITTEVMASSEGETESTKKLLNDGFVVKAEVKTEKGRYTAYGDATPDNVSKMVQGALLRMAETRAIARALRFATGIGKTAQEEVGGE